MSKHDKRAARFGRKYQRPWWARTDWVRWRAGRPGRRFTMKAIGLGFVNHDGVGYRPRRALTPDPSEAR